MATLLDLGFLGNFSPIFTFLFIFALLYGVFRFTKFMGEDNQPLQGLLAFVIAILASISGVVVDVISTMTPWFVLMFFFIIFIIMAFKTLGASDRDVLGVLKGANYGTTISWWIIIFSLIILIGSISSALGQRALERGEGNETIKALEDQIKVGEVGSTATGKFDTNLYNTIFHPKILGMIVILIIASIAAVQITKSNK